MNMKDKSAPGSMRMVSEFIETPDGNGNPKKLKIFPRETFELNEKRSAESYFPGNTRAQELYCRQILSAHYEDVRPLGVQESQELQKYWTLRGNQ